MTTPIGRGLYDHRLKDWQHFVAGGSAGALGRTFTAPLDTMKIMTQAGCVDTRSGPMRGVWYLYKNQGLKAFWKGNLTACVRLFPYSGIQFFCYHQDKSLIRRTVPFLRQKKYDPVVSLMAGSFAGFFATCVTYPLDMVRTRLTVQSLVNPKYHGLTDAFATIYKEEGGLAFLRGFQTSVIGVVPFAGCTFMAYEVLNQLWDVSRLSRSPVEYFLLGSTAASIAQFITYPIDTIRKKMQAQGPHLKAVDIEFRGMSDCVVQTIKKTGMYGLYRGVSLNTMKISPYVGFMFVGYEMVKREFLYYNGYTTSLYSGIPRTDVDMSLTPDQVNMVQRS